MCLFCGSPCFAGCKRRTKRNPQSFFFWGVQPKDDTAPSASAFQRKGRARQRNHRRHGEIPGSRSDGLGIIFLGGPVLRLGCGWGKPQVLVFVSIYLGAITCMYIQYIYIYIYIMFEPYPLVARPLPHIVCTVYSLNKKLTYSLL